VSLPPRDLFGGEEDIVFDVERGAHCALPGNGSERMSIFDAR
jgi:hypothetical protein